MFVPNSTSDYVIRFCEKISNKKPLYLDVELTNDSRVLNCYKNVKRTVKENGGTVQYGWQIWETLPGLMIEAEAHAIWVDPNGKYHDITPKPFGITRILFLPDAAITYKGKQINNIRMALTDEPLVLELIEVSNQYFERTNRGILAYYHGLFVPGLKLRKIIFRKKELERAIIEKYYMQN
jgi:hypothetical protein